MKNTTVGVDLAKNVIQVCVYKNKKVRSNTELTHHEFLEWLFNTHSTTIVFEACSTSNYWKQKAIEAGHSRLWTPFVRLFLCSPVPFYFSPAN